MARGFPALRQLPGGELLAGGKPPAWQGDGAIGARSIDLELKIWQCVVRADLHGSPNGDPGGSKAL